MTHKDKVSSEVDDSFNENSLDMSEDDAPIEENDDENIFDDESEPNGRKKRFISDNIDIPN